MGRIFTSSVSSFWSTLNLENNPSLLLLPYSPTSNKVSSSDYRKLQAIHTEESYTVIKKGYKSVLEIKLWYVAICYTINHNFWDFHRARKRNVIASFSSAAIVLERF